MAHQQQSSPAAPAPAVYRELSPLEAAMEAGVAAKPAKATPPPAPSMLDTVMAEPVQRWSMGRKIVMRGDVQIVRQDVDLSCQGGLFGSVEESAEPSRPVHGTQIALPGDMVEVDRGSGICICGDKGCNIGPFVRTEGGRR